MDVAEQGVCIAHQNAGSLANRIDFTVVDLDHFQASEASVDLMMVFLFRREILRELVKALHPGGLLIYKAYTRTQHNVGGGPTNPL